MKQKIEFGADITAAMGKKEAQRRVFSIILCSVLYDLTCKNSQECENPCTKMALNLWRSRKQK